MKKAGHSLLQALHPVDEQSLLNKKVEENFPAGIKDFKFRRRISFYNVHIRN
jgi:hypothetical protein